MGYNPDPFTKPLDPITSKRDIQVDVMKGPLELEVDIGVAHLQVEGFFFQDPRSGVNILCLFCWKHLMMTLAI